MRMCFYSFFLQKRKKRTADSAVLFLNELVVLLHCCEALAAINGTIIGGLEGNLCFFAAVCANSSKVFSCLLGSVLLSVSAGLASLGLVLETFLGIEFLLTCGEHKLLTTILAYQCLVFVHLLYLVFF